MIDVTDIIEPEGPYEANAVPPVAAEWIAGDLVGRGYLAVAYDASAVANGDSPLDAREADKRGREDFPDWPCSSFALVVSRYGRDDLVELCEALRDDVDFRMDWEAAEGHPSRWLDRDDDDVAEVAGELEGAITAEWVGRCLDDGLEEAGEGSQAW